MKITEMRTYVIDGMLDEKFLKLYGALDIMKQRKRYDDILAKALKLYGDQEARIYSAPGRTEVGGNHTDHQLGKVVGASLNLDVVAVVIPTDDNVVRYASRGFEVKPVDVSDLEVHPD
ncbi:MAG: galactokinase family protein, partial [Erysipelotrichaceae bacterium]|nr:galactokinase family protein [Erysipelotrichaceae bacterium]